MGNGVRKNGERYLHQENDTNLEIERLKTEMRELRMKNIIEISKLRKEFMNPRIELDEKIEANLKQFKNDCAYLEMLMLLLSLPGTYCFVKSLK